MVTAKKSPVARKPATAKTALAVRTPPPAPASKADIKPNSAVPVKTAKPVKVQAKPVPAKSRPSAPPTAAKPPKAKKPKLVRDSFTIPKPEYAVLDDLKQRAARLASPAKKSELLRAGIKALAAMPDDGFLAALKAVPAIKTGRPTTV